MAARRWRYYVTESGRCPVRDFIDGQAPVDQAAIFAGLRDVAQTGLVAARHLVDDIYEVRADGDRRAFRIPFAVEGRSGQGLLALEGFSKKTQKTPPPKIDLARRRLTDWRTRDTRLSHG